MANPANSLRPLESVHSSRVQALTQGLHVRVLEEGHQLFGTLGANTVEGVPGLGVARGQCVPVMAQWGPCAGG